MRIDDIDRDYRARAPQWRRCRDVYEGEDAVKAGNYLPRPPAFTPAEFADFTLRAHFLAATERTVSMLCGLAFRKDMSVKIPSRMKGEVETGFKDITLTGIDLPQLTADTVRDVLLVGRYGTLLDWSTVLMRPFVRTYTSEEILSRSYIRLPSGVMALERVVLQEWRDDGRIKDRDTEYRIEHVLQEVMVGEAVLYEYAIQEWRELADEGKPAPTKDTAFEAYGKPVYPERMGQRMDRIPFVFHHAIGKARAIPKPPMLDLANTNLSHFRTSADREEGAAWTARPTVVITSTKMGATPIVIGGRMALVIPETEAKASMLEYTGQGLGELKSLMAEKREDMAMLGARMLTESKKAAETAEAMRLRATESSASLSDVVVNVGKSMTMLVWLYLWWLYGDAEPTDTDVEITLNKDFVDAGMDPQMLTALVAAVQGGMLSYATFYANLAKGEMTRPGVTWEEEKAAADAEITEDPEPEPEPEPVASPELES